jgi:hypothetical protein
MEHDMLWDNAELGQLSEVSDIAKAHLAQEVFLLPSLQAAELGV